jgi:hypothetical protein
VTFLGPEAEHAVPQEQQDASSTTASMLIRASAQGSAEAQGYISSPIRAGHAHGRVAEHAERVRAEVVAQRPVVEQACYWWVWPAALAGAALGHLKSSRLSPGGPSAGARFDAVAEGARRSDGGRSLASRQTDRHSLPAETAAP